MRVIIADPLRLEAAKVRIRQDGASQLHILSDFDRCLTYGSVDGVKIPSLLALLRDGKHLSSGYAEKAHALFDTYHPIEMDQSIPLTQRKESMNEWWQKHSQLLIDSGLAWSDLEDIVQSGKIRFRQGVPEFLQLLNAAAVPLVIFSASGCGDAVPLFFQNSGYDYPNISYVINRFQWNDRGQAIAPTEPFIHALNKDETLLKDIPDVYRLVKDRQNVILCGDSIGDLGMIEGFRASTLLTIGFLNRDYAASEREFAEKFDIVLEGDGDFTFVNDLIRDIIPE